MISKNNGGILKELPPGHTVRYSHATRWAWVFLIHGYPRQKKLLDRLREFNYIHHMFMMNLLTIKRVLKAAWHVTAVAEGGFY
jgi:hypothetical protein